jgi:hypothetical protein
MTRVTLHPHARARLVERGATEAEVIETVQLGTRFPAKFGRTGFRRSFPFHDVWRGREYAHKQIEAFAVEDEGWLVITVIVRYY